MRSRSYYECPYCHAHLDFGEKCDCREHREEKAEFFARVIKPDPETGQMTFKLERKVG